jgi:hypothetical protein
MWIEFWGY